MDYEPTYFAEEEMFQLQVSHEEGDLTYNLSTGYTETGFPFYGRLREGSDDG
jgi:hypothetical protein